MKNVHTVLPKDGLPQPVRRHREVYRDIKLCEFEHHAEFPDDDVVSFKSRVEASWYRWIDVCALSGRWPVSICAR